jgi:nitrile hydratase accessory protein
LSAPDDRLLPRDAGPGSPVFSMPWHAEALSIANALTAAGMFSPAEWAVTLGAELANCVKAGLPDTEDTYYHAVLAALERLTVEKSPSTGGMIEERVEAWRRAYLNTPHGQPVTLEAADRSPDQGHHDHDHHH